MHLFTDDWSLNQTTAKFVIKQTKIDTVFVLEHNAFNKAFNSKERLHQVHKLLCSTCGFKSYYFLGQVKDGQFVLLQDRPALREVFGKLIEDFEYKKYAENLLDMFTVEQNYVRWEED